MATTRATIAVVEDDAGVRAALQQLLRSAGFAARAFASAEEFLVADNSDVNCLIADINLPGMSGVALLHELTVRDARVPAILITGREDTANLELTTRETAVPRLHKPFSDAALFAAIDRVMRQ
jgi:FixJ family two-component response regulator